MNKVIRLRVKKDLNSKQHQSVLEIKGSLISKGYTDIIHISDEGEEFHINSFSTDQESNTEVLNFINTLLVDKQLDESVWIL